MAYQLVISRESQEESINVKAGTKKGIEHNIFLDNLPLDYKVYLFYYPGAKRNAVLEKDLAKLGDITGKNMLINIGKMNDDSFDKIVKIFKIKKYPVIIITAIDKYASPKLEFSTAYVKMDGKSLLNNSELTLECIEELFNLFLQGKIANAMLKAEIYEEKAVALKIFDLVSAAVAKIANFIGERDILVGLIDGRIELKQK